MEMRQGLERGVRHCSAQEKASVRRPRKIATGYRYFCGLSARRSAVQPAADIPGARPGSTVRKHGQADRATKSGADTGYRIVGYAMSLLGKRERCVTGEVADPNIRSMILFDASWFNRNSASHEASVISLRFSPQSWPSPPPVFSPPPLAAQSTFPLSPMSNPRSRSFPDRTFNLAISAPSVTAKLQYPRPQPSPSPQSKKPAVGASSCPRASSARSRSSSAPTSTWHLDAGASIRPRTPSRPSALPDPATLKSQDEVAAKVRVPAR